ncbi:C-C motif chemokine 4 homolog [Alosa sapidissima]|uniref:C-C motif chemokine 4 homolog n=1 Tax=Alosa sapidissima TaxID=34773 RepID=UPI001C0A3BBF|nr:C-C motif chemokine 4 homolog [Alosa sapidissima]
MKLSCVVTVAVLVLALCSQGQSQPAAGPDKCCFNYYGKTIPVRAIKEYKVTHPSCPKRAVILITMKGKELCANPEAKQVQDIMDKLDDLFGTPAPTRSP